MCKMNFVKVACLIFCALLFYQPIQAQSSNLRINGTVSTVGGRFPGRSFPFSLIVKNYTSPGQVSELNAALQRGDDEMLSVLSRMSAGRIQLGTGVGIPANAIIADPWGDGGTKITVLYERNLSFFELRAGTRSTDYRFGYAEMFLDARGRGQGTLIGAARVRLRSGNTWEVEDFGTFPARLLGLRSSGRVLPR